MADRPTEVLPKLVKLAMEACEADSAGISILDAEARQFRWFALHGTLAAFEGSTTPLDFSPRGITLAQNAPVLMKHPETVYDWVRDTGVAIPEVLLVPLQIRSAGETGAIGTLWVVAPKRGHFREGHARVVAELASFAGVALRMVEAEERIQKALAEQEQLTKEMTHRVQNLFAIADSMIRMTARTTETKDELADKLSGRLHALAQANRLVRRSFSNDQTTGVGLMQAIETVLAPYDRASAHGPELALGEHASNSMALIFHELATNAAKYGALSVLAGSVTVSWNIERDNLRIKWVESGGPKVRISKTAGFGTALVASTVARHGGSFDCDWKAEGLAAEFGFPLSSLTR